MPPIRLQRRESGLVVASNPVAPAKPDPPAKPYGPLEIQDPQLRTLAIGAFSSLWTAMDLSDTSRLRVPGQPSREIYQAHWRLWHYAAETLLGDDAPEREVNT